MVKEKPNICVHIALQYVVDTKISPDDMLCVCGAMKMFSTIFCIVSEVMLGLTSRWQSAGLMLRFFITSDTKSDEQQQKFEDKGCLKWGQ